VRLRRRIVSQQYPQGGRQPLGEVLQPMSGPGAHFGQATERPEAYCRGVPQPGDILDTFFIAPDCCFRIVWSGELRASHCEQPAVWKGLLTVKDRTYMVWACEEHVGDLEEVRRVP